MLSKLSTLVNETFAFRNDPLSSDATNFDAGGTSEKFVGEFIRGHRESVVLATKYSNAAPAVILTRRSITA